MHMSVKSRRQHFQRCLPEQCLSEKETLLSTPHPASTGPPSVPCQHRHYQGSASAGKRGRLLLRMLNNIGYIILNERFESSSNLIPPWGNRLFITNVKGTFIRTPEDPLLIHSNEKRAERQLSSTTALQVWTNFSGPKPARSAQITPTDHNPIHLHLLIPRAPERTTNQKR